MKTPEDGTYRLTDPAGNQMTTEIKGGFYLDPGGVWINARTVLATWEKVG